MQYQQQTLHRDPSAVETGGRTYDQDQAGPYVIKIKHNKPY